MKIKRSLIPILLSIVLFIGSLIGVLSINSALIRNAEAEVLNSLGQALQQIAVNINGRMASIVSLSQILSSDSRLQKSIWRREDDETIVNQLQDIKQLRELVSAALWQDNISLIRLYISDAKLLSHEHVNFYPLEDIKSLPEYLPGKWGGYWYQNHRIDTLGFKGSVLTYCRPIRGTREFELISAFLMIDIDAESLLDVFSLLTLPGANNDCHVFLLDNDYSIVLKQEDDRIDAETASSIGMMEPTIGDIDIQGTQSKYIKAHLPDSGWTLVACIPANNLLQHSRLLQPMMLLLVLTLLLITGLLVASLVSAANSHSVHKQIAEINRSLSSSKGTYPVSSSGNDVFQLNKSINELLETAAQASRDSFAAKLGEQEAILRALQSQINPHFLYNTLDTIHWMAIEANAPSVSHMIETLGYYYRMCLSKGADIITIAEEVAIVRAYLELQSERFDHDFDIVWDLDAKADDCLIPKLTMQPLVENALLHGLRHRLDMDGARLEIGTSLVDDSLVISVIDNGDGLQNDEPSPGYGLTNIRQRLNLFSSGNYVMKISNRPEGGVEARITIPAKRVL